ncbi:MAG: thiamine phosphate synthase [Sphingomonadales bacterium]
MIVRDYRQEKPEQTAAMATLCAQQRRLHISGQHGFRRHYPKWKRIPQRRSGLTSCSVHSAAEAVRARRAKVDICFVSPLFTTQSHPGRSGLGLYPARQLARLSKRPCLALGGINAETLKLVKPCGWFVGHGAISAFLGS